MDKRKSLKVWTVLFLSTTLSFTLSTGGKTRETSTLCLPAFFTTSETMMYVDPAETVTEIHQNFSLDIMISNVLDLYGWEFKLGWNSTFLEALKVTEGGFLRDHNDTLFVVAMNNTEGHVRIVCTLMGNISGVEGNGTLATIEFYVETSGNCILDLYDTKLVSSAEQPIQHTAVDGSAMVIGHDVAISEVTVFPTEVLIGEVVQINVTTSNQGSFPEDVNVSIYYDSENIETKSTFLAPGNFSKLTFDWNTTSIIEGDYVISAAAAIPSDTNITDNTKTANELITILYPGHDVAIVALEPSKTIVGEGYLLSMLITVKNYGTFTEMFNVTTYANTTFIERSETSLASGESTMITHIWNTSGFGYGSANLSAYADPVPGEDDVSDNAHVGHIVKVTIPGDVDGDQDVDIFDIVTIVGSYGSHKGDPKYEANNDIDGDEDVDIFDVVIAALNYGKS